MNKIKVIAFDADDTLWVNEPFYREAEKIFYNLLDGYLPEPEIEKELFKTEIGNIEKYGYGIKGFMLSMIETALRISNNRVDAGVIGKIIGLGKTMLEKPVELLEDVEFVLNNLKNKYSLVVATKGDLLDQQRKLDRSGLLHYFHRIEIMNDKNEPGYQKIITELGIKNEEFLMVGNSIKSDILPIIAIGGKAVHIPYHTTWEHEHADNKNAVGKYYEISDLKELLKILEIK
jgi:putative hydrolase of the HAD superfamily